MAVYKTAGQHLAYMQAWFEPDLQRDDMLSGCDILKARCLYGPTWSFGGKTYACEPQGTLMTDLSLSEDELYQALSKTTRNEVNRAGREGVQTALFEGLQGTGDLLEQMAETYEGMYHEKGMESRFPIEEVRYYAEDGGLFISIAYLEGAPSVFHTYLVAGSIVRLYQSCSEFRFDSNAQRNAISRANRYLHWQDMLAFKERGFLLYDWGGVASLEEPNGIDKFKMSFGGLGITLYNAEIPLSLKGKLWLVASKLR